MDTQVGQVNSCGETVLGRCILVDQHSDHEGVQMVSIIGEPAGCGLVIHPDGYGTSDGNYGPIYPEQFGGGLRLLVWADINESEPTHVIELAGALHSRYIERPVEGAK